MLPSVLPDPAQYGCAVPAVICDSLPLSSSSSKRLAAGSHHDVNENEVTSLAASAARRRKFGAASWSPENSGEVNSCRVADQPAAESGNGGETADSVVFKVPVLPPRSRSVTIGKLRPGSDSLKVRYLLFPVQDVTGTVLFYCFCTYLVSAKK